MDSLNRNATRQGGEVGSLNKANSTAAILRRKSNEVNEFDAEKLLMLISGDIATLHLSLICLAHGNTLPKREIYLAVKSIAAAFKDCEAQNG